MPNPVTADITPDGRRRLARLAALLDADAATWPTYRGERLTFDLDCWLGSAADAEAEAEAADDEPPQDDRPAPACGTTCCAVGLAGLDPEFRREGFAVDDGIPTLHVLGGEHRNWTAVCRFFGLAESGYPSGKNDPFGPQWWPSDPALLEYQLAHRLFFDECYPPPARRDPRAVAARIRRAIAGDPLDDWAARPTPTGVSP